MNITRYLIVNHKGETRIIRAAPTRRSLRPTEYAFKLTVTLPDVRPVQGEISVTVPDWPDAALAYEMYEAVAEGEVS